jgi:hypothetical protein
MPTTIDQNHYSHRLTTGDRAPQAPVAVRDGGRNRNRGRNGRYGISGPRFFFLDNFYGWNIKDFDQIAFCV